ncbi:MAG: AI-2E family transporter [Chloroflexota bacterium]
MAQSQPPESPSPAWQPGTRLAAGMLLLVLGALVLYWLRQLIVPVVLALLLAYLLQPLVSGMTRRLRMPRALAVLLAYLLLGVVLAALAAGMGFALSQQIAGLVADLRAISVSIPDMLERLSELQFTFGPWSIDLSTVNLEPILSSLASALQPLLSQTGGLIASAASATASVVGVVLLVLVLGYYILLDSEAVNRWMVSAAPPPYQADIRRLLDETGAVWHAFLRGQLILGLVVGAVVAIVLTVLGVRFSLVLGLIAGVLEFVPIFGPVIAGLIAVVVALFQGGNWWGLSTLAFGLVVLGTFILIQQVENNILVPRIIGLSLNLHPLLVLLGALAGGALAGVLGLLLAAPVVATLRLWLGYVYRKVVGLETWPGPVFRPRPRPSGRDWWVRLRQRLRRPRRPATPQQESDR